MSTLSRSATSRKLDRIREIFDLSEHDLAALFGVQRQSVSGWRENGMPSSRLASLERIFALAEIFKREFIASRIPEIVRTPDEWLDGRNILETIRISGPEAIYAYLHKLFTYDGA
jgi:transcriptional regulator with XRE-family HTH domain